MPGRRARLWLLRLGTVLILVSGPASAPRAQTDSVLASHVCPPGNLVAGKRPSTWQGVRGRLELPTDGVATPEGGIWNAPLAIVLETGASSLTWDLGAVVNVIAAWIQADANDHYNVSGSVDGRRFHQLGRVAPVDGHGLRGRKVALGGPPVRFLRFGEGQGDGWYSLSEIQVFCEQPVPFAPNVRIVDAPRAAIRERWWNNVTSARFELGLAIAGLALLAWGYALARRGEGQRFGRVRDALLAALGLLAAGAYVNFGSFHFDNFIHVHDTFHYYMGSKYVKELGYERLYECTTIADQEAGLIERVRTRRMTNLRTNLLETTDAILANPGRCKDRFTPERWESFKHDVSWFRGRLNQSQWESGLVRDHGYNATPVWGLAGSALSSLSRASDTQITLLTLVDQAYLVAMCGMVSWAFGWRVLCVALLVFATNFPSRFYWNGGAFLRYDWLFYTVAGVCLLRRDRPLLAGLALAYAALLRVFPGFLLVGPLIVLVQKRQKDRVWDRSLLHLFGGAALGVAVLVPASLIASGGTETYVGFVQNTQKHAGTPLVNNMGLRTVVAYRPSEVGRYLRSDRLAEGAWSAWKSARAEAFRRALPVFLLAVAAYLALLTRAVRHAERWIACALSAVVIALATDLICYYYSFVVVLAVLCEKRREIGLVLLALTGITQFVAWAPLPIMSSWNDEQYTAMSGATLIAFAVILWLFGAGAQAPTGPPRRAR